MTKYSLAYANINDPQNWQDFPEYALPSYVHLPENPNPAQKKSYQRRRLAYFLLWQLGKAYPDFANLMATIEKDELGRPQIRSNFFDFNISHSGEWVGVILCHQVGKKPCIGLDIEAPQRPRNYQALLKYFADKEEQQWFIQQADKTTAFYMSWCIREAVLKATGIGLRKLSDIQYFPKEQHLITNFCPTGNLFFCIEFPFYLAIFIEVTSSIEIHLPCFHITATQKSHQKLNYAKLILVN